MAFTEIDRFAFGAYEVRNVDRFAEDVPDDPETSFFYIADSLPSITAIMLLEHAIEDGVFGTDFNSEGLIWRLSGPSAPVYILRAPAGCPRALIWVYHSNLIAFSVIIEFLRIKITLLIKETNSSSSNCHGLPRQAHL